MTSDNQNPVGLKFMGFYDVHYDMRRLEEARVWGLDRALEDEFLTNYLVQSGSGFGDSVPILADAYYQFPLEGFPTVTPSGIPLASGSFPTPFYNPPYDLQQLYPLPQVPLCPPEISGPLMNSPGFDSCTNYTYATSPRLPFQSPTSSPFVSAPLDDLSPGNSQCSSLPTDNHIDEAWITQLLGQSSVPVTNAINGSHNNAQALSANLSLPISSSPVASGRVADVSSYTADDPSKEALDGQILLSTAFTAGSPNPNPALRAFLDEIMSSGFLHDQTREPLFSEPAGRSMVAGIAGLAGCPSVASGHWDQSIYILFLEGTKPGTKRCLLCLSERSVLSRSIGCVRNHLGHRPFRCPGCQACWLRKDGPAAFYTPALLRDHIQGPKRKINCIYPNCSKSICGGGMQRHWETQHKDSPFPRKDYPRYKKARSNASASPGASDTSSMYVGSPVATRRSGITFDDWSGFANAIATPSS
ncbi:hypothetical protein M408DRAFT_29802 [Serendipita vermifera MAFF 305830]|uniref:C2H2-type domain-containing protein n=1 Tax=Serendipita vermifera MAFF 305830 TaxID=933852 RepID=A0A0C2WUS4_SERVB|nr:hypothetical protein M408DRAFT_29802 [Serendipita vermifera MAFF 305830]